MNNYTYFWNGCFSSWHIAPIKIRGYDFNCCEQYFMACKASMSGDGETAQWICQADDPRDQKKLGREVRGFNPVAWNSVSRDIMFRAHWAKFTQHEQLRKVLLDTQGELVEASPYDKIWGIGLGAEDPRAKDKSQWLGTNWLGEILTEIRDNLK